MNREPTKRLTPRPATLYIALLVILGAIVLLRKHSLRPSPREAVPADARYKSDVLSAIAESDPAQKNTWSQQVEPMLNHPDPTVRRNGLAALEALGTRPASLLPRLTQMALQDPDDQARRNAQILLGRIGGSTPLGAVQRALRSRTPASQEAGLELAGQMGRAAAPAVPAILPLLRQATPIIQLKAVGTIEKIGPSARAAVPALRELLGRSPSRKSAHADIRWAATQALASVGPEAAAAVPALRGLLKDSQATLRAGAITALQSISGADGRTVEALMRMEEDPDPLVRLHVVTALARLAPGSKDVQGLLQRRLSDPDLHVAQRAKFLLQSARPVP